MESPPGSRRGWGLLAAWLFTATLGTTGCSDFGGGALDRPAEHVRAAPPTTRDSAGVAIVENLEPQWTTGEEWSVGPVLTSIGDAARGPAHELFHAWCATRLSGGTVVVGNADVGEIRFFAQDGTFVRKVGSRGGGPGEFRGPDALRDLARLPGDTLMAWDLYAQRFSVFEPNGGFVRSFGLEGPDRQQFFGGTFADGSPLMTVYLHPASESRETMPEAVIRRELVLHRYGVDHRLTHTVGGMLDSDYFQARWGDFGMMSMRAPFGRTTSVSVGGTRFYVSTGDTEEVSVYGQSGRLEMLIRRLVAPVPVTASMVRRDRVRRAAEETGPDTASVTPRVLRMIAELPYPDYLPPYGRTIIDAELNLWMEEFRPSVDVPNQWSVFDSSGVWLGGVTLPEGIEPYEIGADYLLGRSIDEMGVEHIVVHGLAKGSTA